MLERRVNIDESAIVFQDEHYLVVEKPPGIATTSPGGGDSLTARVQLLDRAAKRLHPTSRLDLDVSGLVTFARSKRGTDALLEARRTGRYLRRYSALVTSAPADTPRSTDAATVRDWPTDFDLVWSWPIAIDPQDIRLRRVSALGKPAETKVVVQMQRGECALLEVYPQTGRTHQIRVHCREAGMPIAGDVAYGGLRRLALANGRVVAFPRLLLHCSALSYPAVDGRILRLESPLPSDFIRASQALLGNARKST